MKNYLKRLQKQLKNPCLNKCEIIKEIETQPSTDLLNTIKFQLNSPTFLREWCINEIKNELNN